MEQPIIHTLKTWPEHFKNVVTGIKSFEVRKDDRDFHVGEYLMLEEWCPEKKEYTGRFTSAFEIMHKLDGGQFGIEKGYCVLGFLLNP